MTEPVWNYVVRVTAQRNRSALKVSTYVLGVPRGFGDRRKVSGRSRIDFFNVRRFVSVCRNYELIKE